MLAGVICPDGEKTRECLNKCRMGQRCASLSYLKMCHEHREWTGVPSVTELINGTRLAYLMYKHDYFESPDSQAFKIVGTKGHSLLEVNSGEHGEERITYMGISGQPDEVELQDDGTYHLIDYKVSGSFKVKKLLAYKDIDEWEAQVNMYRILLEKTKGIVISKMFIFCIARDGGTWMAKKDGLLKNIYMKEIKKLNDDGVLGYFMNKKELLLRAVDTNKMPPMCNDVECWGGNRCLGYCPVSNICKEVGDNAYL